MEDNQEKIIRDEIGSFKNGGSRPAPLRRTFLRFYIPQMYSLFGDDWFALRAEAFARFFGTPIFLFGQTLVVTIWILLNATGFLNFDLYPFILLNLAFSTQAAYAAPLILLAQSRQAERDKAHMEADTQHREDIATQHAERLILAAIQAEKLIELVKQNTELTEFTKMLAHRIEALTVEMHQKLVGAN